MGGVGEFEIITKLEKVVDLGAILSLANQGQILMGPIAENRATFDHLGRATGRRDGVAQTTNVRERCSPRSEVRGARRNASCGVVELGADGPARRSSLLSSAWWIGPPPIPRRRPPRATNRMTRSSRRSSPQEAARGFWIRAWGQREPTKQGTSRLSSRARCGEAAQGWAGRPLHSCAFELSLHRTPDPDVDALCLVTR